MGNRSQVVDTTGTTAYTYDSLYRLTGVTYPNADTQSYTYDAMGNRLTKVHNGTTTSSTYNDGDQTTAVGGVSYTQDNNGNQTAVGSDSYSWDAENRLSAATIGGVSSAYAYTGDGLRNSRTIAGATVTYVWNRNAGLPSVLADGAGNRYVYGLDLISREDSGGNLEYYLTDGLGSTVALADGSGNVTGTYAYDAFGAVRTHTGAATEWSYTGEQNDATGLEYLRARYYDSATGRFINRDPLPLMQRYAYVGNNPANFTDPTGLVKWEAGWSAVKYTSMVILKSGCWFASRGGDCRALIAWQQEFIAGAKRAWEAAKVTWNASVQYGGNAGEKVKDAVTSECGQGLIAVGVIFVATYVTVQTGGTVWAAAAPSLTLSGAGIAASGATAYLVLAQRYGDPFMSAPAGLPSPLSFGIAQVKKVGGVKACLGQ